jgi:hypothetical protein
MRSFVAVCDGNTCRSPLFAYSLKLVSGNQALIQTSCSPKAEYLAIQPVSPYTTSGFVFAAVELIRSGHIESTLASLIPSLVSELAHYQARRFTDIEGSLNKDELFVAMTSEHETQLRDWDGRIDINVINVSDFAWDLWTAMGEPHHEEVVQSGYRALAATMILKADKMWRQLTHQSGE